MVMATVMGFPYDCAANYDGGEHVHDEMMMMMIIILRRAASMFIMKVILMMLMRKPTWK